VLIADDHARVRASVRQALEDDGGFVVCAEAEDGQSAFDRAIETRPDVCLLDINIHQSSCRRDICGAY
jgi:DNA-binding NarL/FixJ family response regulator